ncbi:MAG: YHS domain-containing protein, partial [Planctomycetes bacterium]|nr:YHS domain-containing protein [Planctomycetota bacterium]
MSVDPAHAAGSARHAGVTYHFCSQHCLDRFRADPARYTQTKTEAPAGPCCRHAEPPAVPSAGTKYTCPMHPEVVADAPGTCPKCGMALEPVVPQVSGEDDTALRNMVRRFAIAGVLALPVFVLAMAPMVPGVSLPHGLTGVANWIGLFLATPVVFGAGWPIFARAAEAARHRTANMFTLIALGTFAAWGSSTGATLAPDLFPAEFRDAHGTVPTYFEAAAVIVTLVLLGQVLELRARRGTGAAIRALLDLSPATARRV